MATLKKKKVKLDKKDYNRALLTDTIPGDIPIVFSNDGLYINLHRKQNNEISEFDIANSMIDQIFMDKIDGRSKPMKYKIFKNELALRTLFLLHPKSQINYCNFYSQFSDLIVYLCSKSPITIRAPKKIGSSYYSKDELGIYHYKEIDIDTIETELFRKYASSFFAYRGYNRIYKLFDSPYYSKLEKRFKLMWMIDISNCFGSIYTHTIAWAIKNKEFIKQHIGMNNQFGQAFDTLIQRSNDNETNGIPVGPETSRIFAEIILQAIDLDIIKTLDTEYSLSHSSDYKILRYIDDYIIFANTEKEMQTIAMIISDKISNYNLYINDNKINKYGRPFLTKKSDIIAQLKTLLRRFFKKFIESRKESGMNLLDPKKIYNQNSLKQYLLNQVKCIASVRKTGYDEVSSYLIATFSNKVLNLISSAEFNYDKKDEIDYELELKLRNSIFLLTDLIFFFYSVYPGVTSSYIIAKTIILTDDFFKNRNDSFTPQYRTKVVENIKEITFDNEHPRLQDGFISIEKLNIVVAAANFGINYLLPSTYFEEIIKTQKELKYFDIISILYYIKNHSKYSKLKRKIESLIINKLESEFDLQTNSESAHLFLDTTTCPFVSVETRVLILKMYLKKYVDVQGDQMQKYLTQLDSVYWFVNWKNMSLIKLIERKELKNVY